MSLIVAWHRLIDLNNITKAVGKPKIAALIGFFIYISTNNIIGKRNDVCKKCSIMSFTIFYYFTSLTPPPPSLSFFIFFMGVWGWQVTRKYELHYPVKMCPGFLKLPKSLSYFPVLIMNNPSLVVITTPAICVRVVESRTPIITSRLGPAAQYRVNALNGAIAASYWMITHYAFAHE